MHPIVRKFTTTGERLTLILEKYYDKKDFLEVVFLKLGKALVKEIVEPELFLELDQAIIKGHSDPNVYMLFLSFTIQFTSIRNQLERAHVIQAIGDSISRENLSPIEQAYYLLGLSTLALHKGRQVECLQYIKESVSLVSKKHPRYVTLLGNIGAHLSYLGRFNELDKEDMDLLNSPSNAYRAFGIIDMKLTNALFTGNYQEGLKLLEEYKKKIVGKDLSVIENKANSLKLLGLQWNLWVILVVF